MFKKFLIISIILAAFCLPNLPANAQSQYFALAWSADSYVPQNYQGKALPTQGSQIKVVASPLNSSVNYERMTFNWLLDNEAQGGGVDGRGKNYFIFPAGKPARASYQIEVQIMNENDVMVDRQFLSIRIQSPEVLISDGQNDFLPSTISAKTGQTLNLQSAPLFFNIKNPSQTNFSWFQNDQIFSSALKVNPQQVSIQIASGQISESFTKTLSAIIASKINSFEQAFREITLKISQQ